MPTPRHLELLTAICNLPTAPFAEHHVARWLESWADLFQLPHWRDKAGNLYVEYRRGPALNSPLVIEAHMDHPGFLATGQRGQILHAEFRGGVKPSHFHNARVRFFNHADNTWLKARVRSVKPRKNARTLDVQLTTREKIPPASLGMWDLPDAQTHNDLFSARVCDDLATVAATCCLFEELLAAKTRAHVVAMFDRGEEVGFAGVIAACEHHWIPGKKRSARIIGLETSKASPLPTGGVQGNGVVIRVGDRTGIFSPGLTHFLAQAAGFLSDDDPAFKFQRKLMDGGMCNSTPFTAWGYDTAALCLPLGNYHNMSIKGDVGHGQPVPKAAKGIAAETIHLHDFHTLVQLLLKSVHRYPTYKPGFTEIKHRLRKMHRDEHLPLLYNTTHS